MYFDILFQMQQLACPYLVCSWIRGQKYLEISRFLHIALYQVAKMTLEIFSLLIKYLVWRALSDAQTGMSITCLYLDLWAKNLKYRPIFTHSPTRSSQDDLQKIQPPDIM